MKVPMFCLTRPVFRTVGVIEPLVSTLLINGIVLRIVLPLLWRLTEQQSIQQVFVAICKFRINLEQAQTTGV